MSRFVTIIACATALTGAALGVSSCGKGTESASAVASKNYPLAGSCGGTASCPAFQGSAWQPNVAGLSSSNHDGSATVSRSTVTRTGAPLTGLGQAAPVGREVSVTISMPTDLGPNGSLTLEAKVKNFPGGLQGNAYPVLVSLHDGVNELIHLERSGAAGDCSDAGYYTCSGGYCYANSGCSVQWPSAYHNRAEWEQHQITLPTSDSDATQPYPSVNVFPTCNWTGGNAPPDDSRPECAFNSTFFPAYDAVDYPTPRLRHHTTYTARYVLLANSYKSIDGYTADLEVTVVKKTDSQAGGAVDLNVILVGSKNVQASRTPKGQTNLNTLFSKLYSYYDQADTGVKLGEIHAIEFPCDQCGDYYAEMPITDLSYLYLNSAPLISSATQGKAVNLYMVSTLPATDMGGLTILGMAGGIGGPVTIPNPIGGVAFSSFNRLEDYNPLCPEDPATPCADTMIERDFAEFSETVAHELGHYLGLNHPSESDGGLHDGVDDTPVCTAQSGSGYISLGSCRLLDSNVFPSTNKTCSAACPGYSALSGSFCPAAQECQFNHIMWWTTKNWSTSAGAGDGKILSPHSGGIINYSSFIQ